MDDDNQAARRAYARQSLIDSGVDPAKIPDYFDVTSTPQAGNKTKS
jgi:hypothetical protein